MASKQRKHFRIDGTITVCVKTIFDKEGKPIKTFVGMSKCSPTDQFNENVGKSISECRTDQKILVWKRDRINSFIRNAEHEHNQLMQQALRALEKYKKAIKNNREYIKRFA